MTKDYQEEESGEATDSSQQSEKTITTERAVEFAEKLNGLLREYGLCFCANQYMFPIEERYPDLKADTDLLKARPQDGHFILYYDWPDGGKRIRTAMERS